MAEQTYSASCHCQAIAFEAPLDLDKTITCNCSRCQRLGAVLAFTPRARAKFSAGEDATTEYLFNKGKIRHQFCPTCGVQTHAFAEAPDGTPMIAINVNCLEGVDPRALTSHRHDGRSV